ncbi:MAG: asparagine synthase (glutamine-hydrolyzing) [Verrucomicrobia bacterium]|nr:asparagine synthase (glutamine-hydrolyzing) [Verrucomicrobiota bacterium]
MVADGFAGPMDLGCLRHRGPDAQGEWTSPDRKIWFGHTRLSIVDLSPTGAQPMHDPASGNVIIFNGEIYNHAKLREELRASGAEVKWIGTSDTETLLVAYRVWGKAMLPRLKGMFAFVIYDAATQGLFVARGPSGIKPLYYTRSRGVLRFSSEARALFDDTGPVYDSRSVSAYLQWGSCPEDGFIFPRTRILPSGSSMTVNADTTVETEHYWPKKAYPLSRGEDAPKRVRKLLDTAVEAHLMADVPVASFLSGGIDSSVVTALAARALGPGRLQTFSVGFSEGEFDETQIADIVAKKYQTDHHRIELGQEEIVRLVQEAVSRMDAPSQDAINTYIVSKKVAESGIKVALSGLGGDELFGGYPSFRDAPILRRLAGMPQWMRRISRGFGKIGERIADLPGGDIMAIAIWRRRLWTDAMLRKAGLPVSPLRTLPSPEFGDDFGKISWAEMSVYMGQTLLRDSDQMSMAVSLELRVPFLDKDLIEYVLSLPAHEKTRYRITKGLLVEACRDLLPEQVYRRKKMGFALPMDAWMRGPLKEFKIEGLDEVKRLGLLAPGAVEWIRAEFEDGKIHWTRIWSLVILGHYLKKAGANPAMKEAGAKRAA